MNKVFGKKTDFAPIKEDASRVIICYGYEEVDEENATWVEIYIYKKQISQITLKDVKDAIVADIDAQTEEKILTGFIWTDNDGVERHVWLSKENQSNYSEAQRLADKKGAKSYTPKTFKISEDENKKAYYRTFETLTDLNEFYYAVYDFIEQCLGEGWVKKDSIDFEPYEAFFAAAEEQEVNE